jgi:hypothetical protein
MGAGIAGIRATVQKVIELLRLKGSFQNSTIGKFLFAKVQKLLSF